MARLLAVGLLVLVSPRAFARPDGGSFRARCDGGGANVEWERWSRKVFPIDADGIDFSRIKELAAAQPATAERMLRIGLEACDPVAAEAVSITRLRALLPELKDLLDSANVGGGLLQASDRFVPLRVQVVLATNALDPAVDYARFLVPLLSDRSRDVRINAAMGARHFHKDGVSKPLLETVARDGDYLVRYHAAESLLALGDVHPAAIADHGEVFALLAGPRGRSPAPDDFKRFAEAARMLEALMAARGSGRCSAPVRPSWIHSYVRRVNDRVAAVAIDPTESSCAREFALVVFIVSANGSCGSQISETESKGDPTTIELDTPMGKIVVEYSRAAGTARVRGVEIGKTENVAVLSAGADGRVTAKWRGRLDASVKRGEEIVPALLGRSAVLRKVVQP